MHLSLVWQESVRKAADLALKTLSKVGDVSVPVCLSVYSHTVN